MHCANGEWAESVVSYVKGIFVEVVKGEVSISYSKLDEEEEY